MIKLSIDGEEVLVKENTTVAEAAEQAGIYIPKLCFHSKLSRYGACRVCLVKIEGVPKLAAACAVMASDEMKVITDTPEINRVRKTIVELMLLYHPLDCLVCDKGGECELQTLAFKLGVTEDRFGMQLPKYERIDSHTLIERDPKKCIVCGKCVRVCDEIRGRGAIGYTYRGFETRVDFPYGKLSNCEVCGQCLAVCPVGALASRLSEYEARPWEMKQIKSICPYCGCGCSIVLNSKEEKIVRVISQEGIGVNDGKLCAKGRFGYDFVNNKFRLKYPLVKKEGMFVPVSWDEALELIAKKFREIIEKYGNDKIGGIGSNRITNEESYLFQKFMRAVLKTNNVDSQIRVEHAASFEALNDNLGFGAATNSILEISKTDVILLIGTDTTETLPIIGLEIKKAIRENNTKLVVLNSRDIDLTRFSSLWLQTIPGTELILINAMLKVIIDEELYDEPFIEDRTQNFNEVKLKLDSFSLDKAERVTGISKEKIREAAGMYARAKNAMVIYGLELVLQPRAVDNVHALVNLVLACGHIGKENSGIIPLRHTNNGQGAIDMGILPDYLPGYQSLKDDSAREKFEKAWKTEIPKTAGLTSIEMIQSIPEEKIKAMYLVGCNPAISHPNTKQVEANLKALDFLVVQDIFLTETAKLADVVLPAVSFAEKEGTFTNTERRVQRIRKAVKVRGEIRPDWKIFSSLSLKFGYLMEYLSEEEIFDEMTSLVPIYQGIKYSRLENDGIFWPCRSPEDKGTKVLYQDKFGHDWAKFHPVESFYPVENPTIRFPYRIITNGTLFHHRSGAMTRRTKGLSFLEEEPKLWINSKDALGLEVEDNSLVNVTSKQGEIEVKIKVTDRVMKGMVFLPTHAHWYSTFNVLTGSTLDPVSKSPNLEHNFVGITAITKKKEVVALTINGQKITIEQRATILEAAQKLNIYIPTLCHHSEMSPFGACRLCLVEIEGTNKLLPACITPVLNNMKVKTETKTVDDLRKMLLELILAKHPVDCLVCDKGGECDIQKLAFLYGPKRNRFGVQQYKYVVDDTRTLVERDMTKCVLCKKCVRACSEMQGVNAIAFARRSFKTEMGTFFGRALECEFCGRCVAVCPTGALTNQLSKHISRPWELEKVKTICPYCGCGCTMELNIKDEKIIKVTAKEGEGINNGNLCVKGRYGYSFVNDSERLTTPLIKKNKKFVRASWEEALHHIAKNLEMIKEQAGPDAIMGLGSAYCTNEDNYVFQKFMRTVIGTNNVDTTCFHYEHAASLKALFKVFGSSGAMTNSYNEIAGAKSIIIIGTDITETHPTFGLEIKRAVRENNANLIVIDPREIKLTQFAKLWLRPGHGTDAALINGIINIIISQGLIDQDFVESRTEYFEEIQDVIRDYNPEVVSKITGIPKEDIVKAAELFTSSRKGAVLYGMGITQHVSGLQNVTALANLILLTGNIGRPNTGLYPLRGQSNSQGSCDMGSIPDFLPGYQKLSDLAMIKKFEKAWGAKLLMRPGLSLTEAVPLMKEGKVKALYILAGNLKMSYPSTRQIEDGLSSLQFLVVQDMFLTETAKMADVVLPAASFAEADGTYTNMERRVQLLRKAIAPVGESRPDWKIICDLSKVMGHDMDYKNSHEIMNEINKLVPSYGGITYERLASAGLQWPCPDKEHPGTKYLYEKTFPAGSAKFMAEKYIPMSEEPDKDFPFILTTGKLLFHFHTGEMTRRSPGIMDVCPEGFMEMNPKDADRLDIKEKDYVKVVSRRGEIEVKIAITEKTPPGVVFLPTHFKEIPVSIITKAALDPFSHVPEFKTCAVNVKKFTAVKIERT